MSKMRVISFLGCFVFCAGSAWSELRSGTAALGPRRMVTIENDLVRIGMAPELGGRLMEFMLQSSKKNKFVVENDEYLALTDYSVMNKYGEFGQMNYGGLWDIGSAGWPGLAFHSRNYQYKVEQDNDAISLVAWAEADRIGIKRTMRLKQASTALTIKVEEKNLGDMTREMMIRLHYEVWNNVAGDKLIWPGKDATSAKVFQAGAQLRGYAPVWPRKDGLTKIDHIGGWEEMRRAAPIDQGWFVAIDGAGQEALLETFDIEEAQHKFSLWIGGGRGAAPGEVLDSGGSFNNMAEIFGKPRVVEPGQTIAATQTLALIKGLTDVDGYSAEEGILVDIDIPRIEYDAEDVLPVTVKIGAAARKPTYRIEIALADSEGKTLQEWTKETTAEVKPGSVVSAGDAYRLNRSLADGNYTLRCAVKDKSGRVLVKAEDYFRLVTAAHDKVKQAFTEAEALIAAHAKKIEQGQDRLKFGVEQSMARKRFKRAQDQLERNNYQQAFLLANALINDLK